MRAWQPTPVFLPGEFHGQRSLAGYSPWGHKESDTTEWLTISITGHVRRWLLLRFMPFLFTKGFTRCFTLRWQGNLCQAPWLTSATNISDFSSQLETFISSAAKPNLSSFTWLILLPSPATSSSGNLDAFCLKLVTKTQTFWLQSSHLLLYHFSLRLSPQWPSNQAGSHHLSLSPPIQSPTCNQKHFSKL